jgi:hypothetical protein
MMISRRNDWDKAGIKEDLVLVDAMHITASVLRSF